MMATSDGRRYLVVMADDFGIGPSTSRGILDLAAVGVVTGAVLLVNSPYAETDVHLWRQTQSTLELGWHPCLTLDRPLLPAQRVPSLVRRDGSFYPLNQFLRRLVLGRLRPAEMECELRAQYQRFHDLLGFWPPFLNGHHHIHAFPAVARILSTILGRQQPPPYVRRVREPWSVLRSVPGARIKRFVLSTVGRRTARYFDLFGLPANDWLAGITDPECVTDSDYLTRWLTQLPGAVIELACHPGYWDDTLIGRDCTADDGKVQRRVDEMHLLNQARFLQTCRDAGFTLVPPSRIAAPQVGRSASAA